MDFFDVNTMTLLFKKNLPQNSLWQKLLTLTSELAHSSVININCGGLFRCGAKELV